MTYCALEALDTVSLPNICNFQVCDLKITARERFLREEKEKNRREKKFAEVNALTSEV